MAEKKLPIYDFVIDEDDDLTGMVAISLVNDPAFQSKFVAFKNDKPLLKFVEDKKYKQQISGLAIIPDKLVYRVDDEIGEYYGKFSTEMVEKIRNKFHKHLMTNNVNTEHSDNTVESYLVESILLDSDERINDAIARGIEDAVEGAWFVSYKVENEETFEKALEGEYTGFSIEAFLDTKLVELNKNNNNNKKLKMSTLKQIKEKIAQLFKEVETTTDFARALVPQMGFEIEWSEVGEPVYKIVTQEDSEEETKETVSEGEFVTDEGIVVADGAGNLVEVKELPAEEETLEEEEANENEIVFTEVGEPVLINGEVAPEGEVVLDDGRTLIVDADGNLAEIKEVEGEGNGDSDGDEGPTEEELSNEKFGDMTKRLKELIPTDADGHYYIEVSVQDGEYVWGSVSAYTNLELSTDVKKRERKLSNEIKKLKEKLSKPVADPQLGGGDEEVDFSKMSRYEKLMHNKGLNPYK